MRSGMAEVNGLEDDMDDKDASGEKTLDDVILENPELAEELLNSMNLKARYCNKDFDKFAESFCRVLGSTVNKAKRKKEEVEQRKRDEFMSMDMPVDFESAFSSDELDPKDLQTVSDVQDALTLSLCNYACVNIEYIASISSKSMKEVISELRGRIFLDPRRIDPERFYKGWVSRGEYLSGNIIEKLNAAKEANSRYPGFFDENIRALEEVMPEWLDADEIFVSLSSPWVPKKHIENFIRAILRKEYRATHDPLTSSWSLSCMKGYRIDALVSAMYGTKRMDAIEIIEKTLNQQPIVVRDSRSAWTVYGNKTEYVVNEKATLLAQEKQQLLIAEFRKWIWRDKGRADEIRRLYYEKFCCNRSRVFDGSYLKFPGLSEKVRLYDYQKDAVARIIFSPNVLLAHDVGSGKTYEMIAAGMELRRLKLAKKPLYVVPNSILGQWKKFFRMMYEKAKVLVVTPSSFAPAKRCAVLKSIRDDDFDAILMPYSSFGMISLSPDYYMDKIHKLKAQIDEAKKDPDRNTSALRRKMSAVRRMETDLLKKLEIERREAAGKEIIYFESLGIDRLFVDEAHNFKNVSFDTKMSNVLGLNSKGSEKCDDMADKVSCIQRLNGGGGVVFATGTPITNSIADCYVIQRYLQSGDLEVLGLSGFDSWAGMFCEITRDFEIDVDTSKYRMASRLSKFHNLPELSSLLSNVADFHHIDDNKEIPKFDGWTDCIIPKTPEFESFIADISVRADSVRNGSPREITSHGETIIDNMLLITTDGRKGALDLRLVDLPGDSSQPMSSASGSKVWKCASNVFDVYKRYEDSRSAQLVFCDISVPKKTFNIYDELKRLLIDFGIPSDEIAYIHDATCERERVRIMDSVRKGDIRVLIGSTFKLGIGVNVQERLVAVHHIDVPWRPSDMVQREGRILRQGNTSERVHIYRYITENSFDAYSWQLLETKQNFISRLLSGDVSERDEADVDGTVLNYAEVKALAVGNPLIKTRVEKSNELKKLRKLRSEWKDERIRIQRNVFKYEKDVARLTRHMEDAAQDGEFIRMMLSAKQNKKGKSAADARKSLRERIFAGINRCILESKEEKIAEYEGFDVIAPSYDLEAKQFVYICRKGKYKVEVGNNPLGILIRLDNFFENFEKYLSEQNQTLREKQEYIADARRDMSKDDEFAPRIKCVYEELRAIDRELGVSV